MILTNSDQLSSLAEFSDSIYSLGMESSKFDEGDLDDLLFFLLLLVVFFLFFVNWLCLNRKSTKDTGFSTQDQGLE